MKFNKLFWAFEYVLLSVVTICVVLYVIHVKTEIDEHEQHIIVSRRESEINWQRSRTACTIPDTPATIVLACTDIEKEYVKMHADTPWYAAVAHIASKEYNHVRHVSDPVIETVSGVFRICASTVFLVDQTLVSTTKYIDLIILPALFIFGFYIIKHSLVNLWPNRVQPTKGSVYKVLDGYDNENELIVKPKNRELEAPAPHTLARDTPVSGPTYTSIRDSIVV